MTFSQLLYNQLNINEKEADIYADYPALYGVLFALKANDKPIDKMTTEQKANLKAIAGNGNNAQAIAKCILQHIGSLAVSPSVSPSISLPSGEGWGGAEPVYIPSALALRKKSKAAKTNFVQNNLTVSPNPANDYTNLSYTLTTLESDMRLEIIDATGRLVSSQALKAEQDQIVINTANWANGVYICRIANKGYTLFSQKLSVTR